MIKKIEKCYYEDEYETINYYNLNDIGNKINELIDIINNIKTPFYLRE
jgi:hypothetical protein